MWKSQGLTEAEAHFLQKHPQMIDHPQIAQVAAMEAMQAGHERDTEPYWEAIKMNFNNHLNRLQAQATAAAHPATQPTPAFFQPPAPKPPSTPNPASYMSAPVSREVPTGNPRELSPSQVRLTQDEIEIAKASGISITEYARQKLRLEREKRAGLRQNG